MESKIAQTKAGRPKGRGPYRETTQPVRIPKTLLDDIQSVLSEYKHAKSSQQKFGKELWIPKLRNKALTAVNEETGTMDLNEMLISDPATKFLMKVKDNDMVTANVREGNIIIAERKEPKEGDMVIAEYNSQSIIRFFKEDEKNYNLYVDNLNSSTVINKAKKHIKILGVVTNVITNI